MAANVHTLVAVAGRAQLCAVVKADGYGHGAVAVARSALAAGASWLGVAMVGEAQVLRTAGIAAPILVLSEPSPPELDDVAALSLRPSLYTHAGIEGMAKAVARAGCDPVGVHLKVDTGMHRVGCLPEQAVALARDVVERPELFLEAVWTHCATADEPNNPFTDVQAARFEAVLAQLASAGVRVPLAHAANSAATLDHPRLRHGLVRCGIAVYGLDPSPGSGRRVALRSALSLKARVSLVKVVSAGEAVSYGQRHRFGTDSLVATVPLGYADGVARRLSEVGGEVLVGGRRRPMVGTITMDQLLVDCGPAHGATAGPPGAVAPAAAVQAGDEVVLIGEQDGQRISVEEWAARLGTITYEVVCAISSRVPRRYVGGS